MLLYPFLRMLAKSTNSAIQSVLHVLFLPMPFKVSPGKVVVPSVGLSRLM
ncbi:hypothetical protein BDQ17DRAFT_1366362 [Cyathus striatus]|nr:hypothetical protein BDQ17DRAFT_1366362 [Cyathus striatus]